MIESQDGNLKPKEPLLSSRTTQHQMLISSRELDLRLAHKASLLLWMTKPYAQQGQRCL